MAALVEIAPVPSQRINKRRLKPANAGTEKRNEDEFKPLEIPLWNQYKAILRVNYGILLSRRVVLDICLKRAIGISRVANATCLALFPADFRDEFLVLESIRKRDQQVYFLGSLLNTRKQSTLGTGVCGK